MKYRMLTAIGLLAIGATANAHSPFNDRFYVGADFERSHFDAKSYLSTYSFAEDWNNGVSILGGYRWQQFGAELGYTYIRQINWTFYDYYSPATVKQTGYNVFLDGIYYHPISECFDLKGLLGVGLLNTKYKSASSDTYAYYNRSSTQPGVRVGVGAEYQINHDFSTDLMFKYQAPGNRDFKNVATIAVGIKYHF